MKFYKIMFFLSLMTGSLISISSSSWVGMWMGLEINLLSIIPLMNSNKNLFASEASLKYFITQALASTALLFSIILMLNHSSIIFHLNEGMTLIFNSALLTKMGAAPFHFWFPEIIEGLSWLNSITLLTWQKIAPMIILMYNNSIIFISIITVFSMMVSGIMGFNQTSLRKILAYSSINHIAWMLASMMVQETVWMYYFLVYSLISINIALIFNMMNIFFLKQLFVSLNSNPMVKFFFISNFFSLGGLPPFLGFMPKWMTIENLVENNFLLLTFLMVTMTLFTLYFYIRLIYSTLTINMNELNFTIQPNFNQFWIMFSNFISLISLLSCSLIFNMA